MDGERSHVTKEAICEACGGYTSMEQVITVKMVDPDGAEVEQKMTEWGARQLLDELGIPQPPVLCDRHRGDLPSWVEQEYSVAD